MPKYIFIDEDEQRALIMECLIKFHEENIEKENNEISSKDDEKIRGIRGLAEYLNCSIATAQKIKKTKGFPFYQVQRLVYFKKPSIDEFFRNKQKPSKFNNKK